MTRRRLSKRQRERIAQQRQQRRDSTMAAAGQSDNTPTGDTRQGRVIVRHGQNLLVRDTEGINHHCLMRQTLNEVVCGDHVLWQATDGNQGIIIDILERNTLLSRPDYSGRSKPLVANITQLIVVLAPQPAPTGYLTDQYLLAAELIGVKALIVLNKADLMTPEAWNHFHAQFQHYANIGYPIISASTKQTPGLTPLLPFLPDQTSILVGQSGVGKSSLINALIPEQEETVGALSDSSGLGKHTTSIAKLHFLGQGGEIIDSPGVRSFRLGNITARQLEQGFAEFAPFRGRCRFSNCTHRSEPGCAFTQAVGEGKIAPQRLENYLHMAAKLRQAKQR